MKEFKNEIFLDFTDPIIEKNKKALLSVRAHFGKEYPNFINGKAVKTTAKTISLNPANTDETIGIFQKSEKMMLKQQCKLLKRHLKHGNLFQ